jgi:hypothetical protein
VRRDADTLVALALCARASRHARSGNACSETAGGAARSFADALRRRAPGGADAPLGEIVASAVPSNGYDRYLCAAASPERRMANVHKLVRLAREFERREGRDLRRFADALSAGRVGALREPRRRRRWPTRSA